MGKVNDIWVKGFEIGRKFDMVKDVTIKIYNGSTFNALTGSNTESFTEVNCEMLFTINKTGSLDNLRAQVGEFKAYVRKESIGAHELSNGDLVVVGSKTFKIEKVNIDGADATYTVYLRRVGSV